MASYIKKEQRIPIVYHTDVAVAGCGCAGTMAAVAAARNGVNVLVIERYGFPGGAATAQYVPLISIWNLSPWADEEKPLIGGLAQEICKRLDEVGGSIRPEEAFSAQKRGDFPSIIREVRWELDLRGHSGVGIFVSGGLDEEAVRTLGEAGADGFGVGTYVSCAPAVDFAFDIVEVEGRPSAKRGKLGGRKQVWRCPRCMVDIVRPATEAGPGCPRCGGEMEEMLRPLIRGGEIVGELPEPKEIRRRTLAQIDLMKSQP